MPHIRADAPACAFAVPAEFDQSEGDAELLVRLIQGGHVFCAGEAGQGWAAPALRAMRSEEDKHG